MIEEVDNKKRKLSNSDDLLNKKLKSEDGNDNDNSSSLSGCFYKVSTSLYISLAPVYLNDPVAGIKAQHLDPLLMTFFPEAGGVVLSHYNLQLCGQDRTPAERPPPTVIYDIDGDEVEKRENPLAVAKVMYDSPMSFMWINVDLLVWKPSQGDAIEGWINMQSPSHIGLLIHDTFNASIKRDAIPKDWKFIPNQEDETIEEEAEQAADVSEEDAVAALPTAEVDESEKQQDSSFAPPRSLGYWVDGNGLRIDGKLKFTVKYFNVSGRTVSVQGSLLKPGSVKEDLTQPFTQEEDTNPPPPPTKAKHVTFVESEANEESSD